MANPLLKEKNDLDFGSLEPGDLLLVANPTDPWYIRYTLFWSHVGIVTPEGVVDAIRDPRGEYAEPQKWGTVQSAPIKVYAANHDILALRVKCSPEVRGLPSSMPRGRSGSPIRLIPLRSSLTARMPTIIPVAL